MPERSVLLHLTDIQDTGQPTEKGQDLQTQPMLECKT